jgi:hypothetical protein
MYELLVKKEREWNRKKTETDISRQTQKLQIQGKVKITKKKNT